MRTSFLSPSQFSVYKGKGAMQLSLIAPTWIPLDNNNTSVGREGAVYLEFAVPAEGASSQV